MPICDMDGLLYLIKLYKQEPSRFCLELEKCDQVGLPFFVVAKCDQPGRTLGIGLLLMVVGVAFASLLNTTGTSRI